VTGRSDAGAFAPGLAVRSRMVGHPPGKAAEISSTSEYVVRRGDRFQEFLRSRLSRMSGRVCKLSALREGHSKNSAAGRGSD
jgi:hypothetical protein